ncbi:MAG: adenylate/guanylate cyclase domain-containing protein [Labrenzia sp.]
MTDLASIENHPVDQAPRSYPSMVELLRRGQYDTSAVPRQTIPEVEAWLLDGAVAEDDFLLLYQAFMWRLVAAGLPVVRASLHVGTLHPQLFGYAWNWNSEDGLCDEVKVDEAVLMSDAYKKNPLSRVIDTGAQYRSLTDTPDASESPLLRDLASQGITEYAVLPLRAHGTYHNAATVATRQRGGFTAGAFERIEALLRLLALHVERHIEARISKNIVTTYLGGEAGCQVLTGAIKRGSGLPIDAIIWASDLRGFTQLASKLTDRELTAVLDVYFDQLVAAVMDHGGEVLKFIGDGLLAVFPFDAYPSLSDAADAAIRAGEAALTALEDVNGNTVLLADITGWRPLKTGIALHRGEVFFGNVGAPQRLDFTVIGKAVNAVSRMEALCKSTGQPLLLSKDVCDLSSRTCQALGQFELKGLGEPVSVFAPLKQ